MKIVILLGKNAYLKMWGSSIRHNLHPFGTYSHTNKNETASLSINLRLRIIPLMFQMPNSFIIGFKNMNVSMIGFQYICDVKEFYSLVSKIFCHFCWSANNFQVGQGHWRNLWLTLPTKQKKIPILKALVNSSGYFQQDNFFSQGIYKFKSPLTFLWEKNWAFLKSYIMHQA